MTEVVALAADHAGFELEDALASLDAPFAGRRHGGRVVKMG